MAMLKGKGVLEICCLLSLTLLAMVVQSHQVSFGSKCGPDPSEHCDINSGLICHNSTCQCGTGSLTASIKYLMRWDAQAGECVALENGACIGNRDNPVDDAKLKKVRCAGDMICKQVESMPPGVGVCKKKETEGANLGSMCGPQNHCAVNKGLICHETKCQCGNGTVTDTLMYQMIWSAEADECVALETGVCIGNANNTVADNRLKRVRCAGDLVCKQVETMPAGVGVCTKEEKDGGGNKSGSDKVAMGLVNIFVIVLSIFIHLH